MSADDSNLFSELKLSQIATMMPALAQKSKESSGHLASFEIELDHPENEPVAAAHSSSTNDETKKGISRLNDFLQRKKKKPKEEILSRIKEISLYKFVLMPSQIDLKNRAFQTYGWVQQVFLKTYQRGSHVNKFI